jgi:large subunit ribosomal protein L25
MKAVATFEATPRENTGKGAARTLRRQGFVPAIVYGHQAEPAKISLPLKELTLQYYKGSFFNKIVDITIDGKVVHTLPRDVQTHPVTDIIEHADFQRVDKDSVIHVHVPVRVLNQEKSVGLKRGGVLNIVRHEIELICKPDSIPASVDVDVLSMDIGHSLHINDVKLPDNVKTAIKGRNFTIITVAGRTKEEEERPVVAAAVPGAEGAAAPAGGAAPGTAAPAAPGAKPAPGAAAPAAGAAAKPAGDAKGGKK